MEIFFGDDITTGSLYGCSCDSQFSKGINYCEASAEKVVTAGTPESTACSCHEHPQQGLRRTLGWESSFASDVERIDHWIESNERMRTQAFQGISNADVGPSDPCLGIEGHRAMLTAIDSPFPHETSEEDTPTFKKRYALRSLWRILSGRQPYRLIFFEVSLVCLSHANDTFFVRPALLQCKWEGCTYSRRFSRTADLLRHVGAVHLTRGQYHCPIDAGCKSFNRKDNLTAHMKRRHNIDV